MRVRARAEDGYTMIAAIGAVTLISVLAAAALAASNGDLGLVQRNLDSKRAHAAAQAGIANYSFHLNNDNSYWSRCTEVPEPNAINQERDTPEEVLKKRSLPESDSASYAIELLPATGAEECDPDNPVETMLEQGDSGGETGSNVGSFRIRSTGYAGDAEVSLVATYKRASLLDYVYFTQYETSDPVTYGTQTWSSNIEPHCARFIREGRQSASIPGSSGRYCDKIVFPSNDEINGPLHTNDNLVISGSPTFGRDASDVTEVGAPEVPPNGWHACSSLKPDTLCSTANPTFKGPFVTTAPVLKPPKTNGKLKDLAGDDYLFECQTTIELEGDTIEVTTRWENEVEMPFPPDGVIYVANGVCPDKGSTAWSSCKSDDYSPFQATYPAGSDCGNVKVYGEYSDDLTIAAENHIIVWNELERVDDSPGILGLIANKFVRVRHPYSDINDTTMGSCGGDEGSFNPINRIDAAILAIDHSFIVDHYDCGNDLGTLTVNGAISQKYRGAVGVTYSSSKHTGYEKNYQYDDRLRYMEPPHFLNPVEPSWHIRRETLDFPKADE
ncbi:MAG TPA: hypothetical protein VNP96_09855 [Solirubrobacterales bacterium]|nr:hypothetical protein [Solirubrobacterales bacterium]